MFAKIAGVRIAAIRAAVPAQEARIEDELEFYGGSLKKAQRAKKMIGTDRRRLAWPGQTASDLCHAAAQSLLQDHAGLQDKIDALIYVSQSPDFLLPATACILQHRLGLPQTCAAFDVNQGCAGFVYGLWLAACMVNSGCSHILLLAGDAPATPRDVSNRIIAPIFGDGGSAALISADPEAQPLLFSIGTDGAGYDHIIVPAGGHRLPYVKDFEPNRGLWEDITTPEGTKWRLNEVYMDGASVFAFTLRVVPDHVRSLVMDANLSVNDIDHFIFHQANRQIIAEIAKKAGLPPERVHSETFSNYGNLSSASIPATLCDVFGQNGSTGHCRILLSGYGVGLSWASCIWNANDCDCAPVIDVARPDEDSWEEKVEFWRHKLQGIQNDND